jgi:diadenosine tetraphosphate (Ap4A) HIT family hydrolase
MTDFALDQRLAADTVVVTELPLSRVLVMNDARYPWLILVPRRPGAVELFDLEPADRVILCEEVALAGSGLKKLTGCAKINIAALGNVVPQLHVHVVARNQRDPAWPGPVWGHGARVPYAQKALAEFLRQLVNTF